MSTSIHPVIEYRDKLSGMVMSFADLSMGVSFSDIFARLGASGHDYAETVVPIRGYPRFPNSTFVEQGWLADRRFTMLVVADQTEDLVQDSDGTCVSPAYAQSFIERGQSTVLPYAHDTDEDGNVIEGAKYWRITDPDIHSVNWVTADELEKAVDAAGHGYLDTYRAAIAAMRALEADEGKSDVRFIYGFDN